ncbi:lysylphosphatidylglycerol synthase transmembrane domain-containing protein [Demequina maris]|uniref:lysylphosphatidylglycerol synthase transmembrane domain-containing protein n=1 Tax=Demequina maris TaxID=1638982 RepID=UPI0007807DE6|nr:lysylphosphatidylglycerol synthase transmembrane domain-containing protein [Demequina maris]
MVADASPTHEEPSRVRIVDEPETRVRRLTDIIRLLLTVLGIIAVLLIAEFAIGTTRGITQDIASISPTLRRLLIAPVNLFTAILAVIIPAVVITDMLVRREPRRLLEALGAAILGVIVTLIGAFLLLELGTDELLASLTPRGAETLQLPAYVAAISALLTAAGRRPTRRTLSLSWNVLWLGLAIAAAFGAITIPSILLTVLFGRAAGLGLRYWVGSTADRAYGDTLVEGLRRAGFEPISLVRADLESDDEDPELDEATAALSRTRQGRVYAMTTAGQHRLLVVARDGDQQAAGSVSKLWASLRLRGIHARPEVSLRQSSEATALVSHAARVGGVRTGRVLGMSQIRDTMLLVYQRPPAARPFGVVPAEEVDDALLDAIWAEVATMHRAGISHRLICGDTVLVGVDGEPDAPPVWLTSWELGEVATSAFAQRVDVAQALAMLAVRVGPQRAVDSAFRALGARPVEQAAPLLQGIVLPPATRAELKAHKEAKVLEAVRAAILARSPDAEVAREDVTRFGWRTVITIVLGLVAATVILAGFNTQDFIDAVGQANPWWMAAAFVFSMLTYVGAALALFAFSPVRIPFIRILTAQFATAYISLAVPAGVGPVALNVRLLTKRKVAPPLAVATGALMQVSAGVVTVLGLIVLTVASGSRGALVALPSTAVLIAIGVVVLVVAALLLIPWVRAWAHRRIVPTVRQTWPRLRQIVGQPWRLALGLSGSLLLAVAYIGAFRSALAAFGQDMALIDAAVLYFVASAVGSAVPTPGGLGAVEFALTSGLAGAGVPWGIAVSVTLVYRLVTYWLPIPIGYVAMRYLERRGEL